MRYLIILLITCHLQAQKGLINYGHIESPGMRSAAGPDLNAYLIFNKQHTYYVTAKDSLEQNIGINNKTAYSNGNGQQAVFNGNKTFRYGKQVYYNREKDSMWWSQRFQGNIYIAEKKPAINWTLLKETKKIGKFKTHKATAKFRGRLYTAWYTLEVPLPYGPWKLHGLPGLILEAYDEKKEMFLYFKSLEYPTKNKTTIHHVKRPPEDGTEWQTIQDFETMLKNSLTKAYNGMVLRAEQNGGDKPNKPIFKDIYIESFD